MNVKSSLALAAIVSATLMPAELRAEPVKKVAAAALRNLSAAEVNGTWRSGKNTFKIWDLGKGMLQVEFNGVYEYKSPVGPLANFGFGSGITNIVGDTSVLVFGPSGGGGKITMKFSRGRLTAEQEGTCGFGSHVHADGTYRKVGSRKPKFGE